MGGPSAVIYAYVGEFNDNYHRPRALAFTSLWVGLSAMTLPALAWLILPMTWSFYVPILNFPFRPWRLLVLLYAVPSMIFATALIFLPESPKFLWVQRKSDQALNILKRMYVYNTRNPEFMYCVSITRSMIKRYI